MYKIGSPSVKEIAADGQILLPRFQRKKSWSASRRFELCISLFSDYPMGTIVVKNEESPDGTKKWLLDGRQRRDTFVDMFNPDNIYFWAQKYLKLQSRLQRDEVRRRFEEIVTDYLQFDDSDETDGEATSSHNSVDVYEEDLSTPVDETEIDVSENGGHDAQQIKSVFERHKGLEKLADIICNVHPIRKKGSHYVSNFTEPFFFGDSVKMSYIEKDDDGKNYVDSAKLVKWISNHTEAIKDSKIDSLTVDNVLEWIDNPPEGAKESIQKKLEGIKTSIKTVRTIANRMANSQIIVIELDDTCHSSDERKIFEIINTKGVPLTGPEIMSAKPNWNKKVEIPSSAVLKSVNALYNALGTEMEDVVRWDVAATFTDRLDPSSDFILGELRTIPFDDETTSRFERKITSGFKLMCGRYRHSIAKDNLDLLSEEDCWDNNDFEEEIRLSCKKLLASDTAFKTLASYKVSISSFLSYTIGINYLLLVIKSFKNHSPSPNNHSATREFVQDCRILLDRFVYEYATGVWSGSSDARLTRNLSSDEVFKEVPKENWDKLIDEVYASNTIDGQHLKTDAIKGLLFYFSMVRDKKLSMNFDEKAEIDHIIPDSKFNKNSDNTFRDSLINYALLPSSLNKEKLDHSIENLEPSKKSAIYALEDIDSESASNITGPGDIEKLRSARIDNDLGLSISEAVKKRRAEFVSNSGYWGVQ